MLCAGTQGLQTQGKSCSVGPSEPLQKIVGVLEEYGLAGEEACWTKVRGTITFWRSFALRTGLLMLICTWHRKEAKPKRNLTRFGISGFGGRRSSLWVVVVDKVLRVVYLPLQFNLIPVRPQVKSLEMDLQKKIEGIQEIEESHLETIRELKETIVELERKWNHSSLHQTTGNFTRPEDNVKSSDSTEVCRNWLGDLSGVLRQTVLRRTRKQGRLITTSPLRTPIFLSLVLSVPLSFIHPSLLLCIHSFMYSSIHLSLFLPFSFLPLSCSSL